MKIKVMSENLANKISAGEVVEKCASIVKELVENSIDAESSQIKVELIDGGIKKIIVSDDGTGMDEKDAVLAFSRHATSKIIKEEDIYFISSLGFRGEALPSIASVSEVILETNNGETCTLVNIKGGKTINIGTCTYRKGTKITVSNLFYNTPARLKFLKSDTTELANSASYLEKLALSHPSISFTLINNDKLIFKTSGSNNLLKAIHEIYGMYISSNMIKINNENDDFSINGYICKPEILKGNRNHMITFLNNRVIKNMDINRAINDAYYTYKPDSKYPITVLNIKTDVSLVDVNIHPTKQDVKISKMDSLYNLILETIKQSLYNNLLIPKVLENKETVVQNNYNYTEENISEIKEETTNYQTKLDLKDEFNIVEKNYVINDILEKEVNEQNNDVQEKNIEVKELSFHKVGIAHGTYIIAENESGIYLIDQHAAAERVNYEKYLHALINKKISKIAMLLPITIELSSSDYIKLMDNIDELINLGFDTEIFGINTIIIKSHPTWLLRGYESEQTRRIVDMIIGSDKKFDRVKFNEHLAITLACKTSIKANYHISDEETDYLLSSLVKCDNPYNCPHGRPTIIEFTLYDLEKMFKRVMN